MAGENLLVVDDSPTILKVVESALTRAGYQVDTALDVTSGLELARSRRPAAILIDSLIAGEVRNGTPPKRQKGKDSGKDRGKDRVEADDGAADIPGGGLHLCGALAADSVLSRTPVVLMTAKGEDLETRYSQVPNVVDYITKPFSPEAIVAVVTNVIEKTTANVKGTIRDESSSVTDGAGATRATRATLAPSSATAGDRGAVAQALSQSGGAAPGNPLGRLRAAVAERLEQFRRESTSAELMDITEGALPDEILTALLGDAGYEPTLLGAGGLGLGDAAGAPAAGSAGGDPGPDLAGKLGSVSLSEVITLLGQQGETGILRVLADSSRVDIFFNKGRIDLAAAVGVAEEFLLGRFAVEAGHLTPEALARVLDERARASGKPPLFGRDLTGRGLITMDQLKAAMSRQTAELAYETLRWPRGVFQFRRTEQLPELAEDASLGITVDTLLLEGFRRVDEWRLIERDIQNFDLVFLRAEDRLSELPRGTLTRDEIAVLDALSGKNSVRDVVRSLRMGSFDVSKILYRLLRTKLIRRRIQPVAAS